MKILIVEDEEAIAGGLKFNFEQEGYEAVVTADGPTALEKFQHEDVPFDLVVMDLMRPTSCTSLFHASLHASTISS